MAARYARRALEIIEMTEHTYYTARAHQLLAHVELDRGRPDAALEALERAKPLIAETGNPLERRSTRSRRRARSPRSGARRRRPRSRWRSPG